MSIQSTVSKPGAQTGIGRQGGRLSLLRRQEERIGWLLVSPWVIGFILLTAGPMLYSLGLSLFDANMLRASKFIGLQNYQELFTSPRSLFWISLYNTFYYVIFSVPLKLAIALGLALALNQPIKGQGLFRTLYYIPSILPPVATSVLWLWVFHRDFGILNGLLGLVGLTGPPWLTSPDWAKPALILMSLWQAGASLLILLAGLQGVPTDLYDAVKVDGAGAWARFRAITLPMVSPTLFFVLVTEILASFQVFVVTLVMTDGGPANSTLMYVLYLYRVGFERLDMGFASALAWVYFLILMVMSTLIFRSSALWLYYEGELLGGDSRA